MRVSGVPQPEDTWYKDGVPLRDSDKYRIKRDGDASCLYVMNCEPSDQGVYKAVAKNKEGEDSCEAKLDVVDEMYVIIIVFQKFHSVLFNFTEKVRKMLNHLTS